jgi:hypothetical protein
MKGICSAFLDNNERCYSRYILHTILFMDISSNDVELVQVCKSCYDRIMRVLNERLVTLSRKRDNLQASRNQEIAIIKQQQEYYHYTDLKINKIQDLTKIIKDMALNQCRNDLCMKNLNNLGKDEKIFSVSTFKPYGKRHHTFYLCSRKCFRRMKAIFGVIEIRPTGQTLLDNILVK